MDVGNAAHAVRPVRHEHLGDTQPIDRCGGPGAGARAQSGFFFERHLLDEREYGCHEMVSFTT